MIDQYRKLRVAGVGLLGQEQVVERERHVGSLGSPMLPVRTRIGPFLLCGV